MIHSFLLIGQSNMAGRGLREEEIWVDTTHIKTLRNGKWQQMFRPINPDCWTSGANLAESFAEKYAATYGVDVGLICCAYGGSSLDQWKPGGLLFDNAVNQARLASRTSTIAGVLWHQGEQDCHPELAATYRERFEKMMQEFRRQLDLYDVPFLVGEIGDFLPEGALVERCRLDNYKAVNKALAEIAANNEMTGLVSAAGLTSNADKLHFNSPSLYEFGLRYFAQFEKLRNPSKVFEEKCTEDEAVVNPMEGL